MKISIISLVPVAWTALVASAAVINTATPSLLSGPENDQRVTNGTVVAQGKAPFLVRLNFVSGNSRGLCGGTIIDSKTIVTAGHCVYKTGTGQVRRPEDTYVYVGSVSSSDKRYIQPTGVILHPDYDPHSFMNDIAVLRTPDLGLKSGSIEAIQVYTGDIAPKQAMEIYGWGTTKSHGTSLDNPSSLLTQTAYVSEPQACQVIEPRYANANGTQICTDANYNVGVDVCQGDSGTGSTIKKNGREYFAGLVSYGTNKNGEATCGEAGSFGMYTRISPYLPWISSITGNSYTGTPSSPSTTPSPTPVAEPPRTCLFFFICF
ncbi:CLIP domain-containing serine protease [Coemansia sp. RSA 552]|nr:CLIP domain-containing serine protease [Coemansia sp. RSA 552]